MKTINTLIISALIIAIVTMTLGISPNFQRASAVPAVELAAVTAKVEQNILVPGGAEAYQQAECWRQRAEDTKVGLLRERRAMIATMYYLKAIYEEGVMKNE